MPANNINIYALEKVLEASKRYMQISEWFGHSPLDNENFTLDTAIYLVEKELKREME